MEQTHILPPEIFLSSGWGVEEVVLAISFDLLLWPFIDRTLQPSVAIKMSALQDLTNVQEAQTATRMDNNGAEKKRTKISWSEAMKVIVGYKKKEAKKSYTYPPMDPTYY